MSRHVSGTVCQCLSSRPNVHQSSHSPSFRHEFNVCRGMSVCKDIATAAQLKPSHMQCSRSLQQCTTRHCPGTTASPVNASRRQRRRQRLCFASMPAPLPSPVSPILHVRNKLFFLFSALQGSSRFKDLTFCTMSGVVDPIRPNDCLALLISERAMPPTAPDPKPIPLPLTSKHHTSTHSPIHHYIPERLHDHPASPVHQFRAAS